MERYPENAPDLPEAAQVLSLTDVIGPSFVVNTTMMRKPQIINGMPYRLRTTFADTSDQPLKILAIVPHQRADNAVDYHRAVVKAMAVLEEQVSLPLIAKMKSMEAELEAGRRRLALCESRLARRTKFFAQISPGA